MQPPDLLPCLIVARQILDFGHVMRATWHPDHRAESDTTHTVMLGVLAVGLQPHAAVQLDPGTLARLAYVHDYAELYAGDTNTAGGLTPQARAAKAERERLALVRIYAELSQLPAITELIERYEAQACDESRWLRYLDKILPKLTHWWNGCAAVRAAPTSMTLQDVQDSHQRQGAELRQRYPAYTMLHSLFDVACEGCEAVYGDDSLPPQAWNLASRDLLLGTPPLSPDAFRQQLQQVAGRPSPPERSARTSGLSRLAAATRPHQYPGLVGGRFERTSDCSHGCGAVLAAFRSRAPDGVDPFGECPAHPDRWTPSCTCYLGCDGDDDTWHQHADDPCPVHPDRPVRS